MKKYLVGLCISIIIAMLAPNLAKAVDATKINPKEGWRLKCDENFCAATHTMTIKDQGFPLCIMHISNQALVGSQISPNGGEFRAMCSLMSPPPEIILVFEKEEVPISIYSFNNNYAYAHLDILNYRSQITHKKHFKIRIPESETKVSGKSIKIREAIYTVPTAGLKEAIEAIIELNKSRHGITTK